MQNGWSHWRGRSRRWLGLGLIALLVIVGLQGTPGWANGRSFPPSQYAATITAPFNQPSDYPLVQTPPSSFYRPTAAWFGRLILPSVEQYQQWAKATAETDWAWFEVYTAPANAQNLLGQTVRLAWAKQPFLQQYVSVASRDVRFTERAKSDFQHGITNPIRLDGRNQVGPLQSVAGGLFHDVVAVQLRGTITLEETVAPASPVIIQSAEPAPDAPLPKPNPAIVLRVDREPVQDVGRFQALVQFIEAVPPVAPASLPPHCPGNHPCPSDLLRVRHYNPQTKQFDGPEDVIRIPQQPADHNGVFNMTTRELANSPAGAAGWYIYGAKAQDGRFTVQGLRPRSLFRLPPQETILGFNPGLRYIRQGNWQAVENRKGTVQTVLVDADADSPATAVKRWNVGDRFFLLHLFGGRGGTHEKAETFILGTYAGHSSFGVATIMQDPFTTEPIFDADYIQVYGNTPDGTLSGGQTWTHYMGNLRRGFMGIRPVSDGLVKLDTLTADYNFGDTKLSFFNELITQLSLVAARYRIGDGTGNSTITSATSCVQDSAQAVFHTLLRFRQKIESNPDIVKWMAENPNDPNTQRFIKLVKLGQDLKQQLTPMGVVRWDWEQNAEILTGVEQQQDFLSIDDFHPRNLATGLISWRTAMPRQAQDEFAMLFLRHGAALWFLRTNIIGGNDPGLAPLEPTLIFGAWRLPFSQVPLLSYLVIRTFGGVTIPTGWDWLTTMAVLVGFGTIALVVGFSQGILRWQPWQAPWYRYGGTLLRLLIVPALLQEYVFRVLLIPYPKTWISGWIWWTWALLALGLFVAFQLGYARLLHRSRYPIVAHPMCISLMTILGLACTLTYRLTGSLWTIAIVHWVFVSAWWLLLGGRQQVQQLEKQKLAKLA